MNPMDKSNGSPRWLFLLGAFMQKVGARISQTSEWYRHGGPLGSSASDIGAPVWFLRRHNRENPLPVQNDHSNTLWFPIAAFAGDLPASPVACGHRIPDGDDEQRIEVGMAAASTLSSIQASD